MNFNQKLYTHLDSKSKHLIKSNTRQCYWTPQTQPHTEGTSRQTVNQAEIKLNFENRGENLMLT